MNFHNEINLKKPRIIFYFEFDGTNFFYSTSESSEFTVSKSRIFELIASTYKTEYKNHVSKIPFFPYMATIQIHIRDDVNIEFLYIYTASYTAVLSAQPLQSILIFFSAMAVNINLSQRGFSLCLNYASHGSKQLSITWLILRILLT